jgi:hypothetical protein
MKKLTAIWRLIKCSNYALVSVHGEKVHVTHGKGDFSDGIALATKLIQTYNMLSDEIEAQTAHLTGEQVLEALRLAVAKLEQSNGGN